MGDIELPETKFSKVVDQLITTVGLTAAWLWVVLLCIIVSNVALRYLFGEGRIEFEEIQWHLNALAFLIAIAYAYRVDAHIRIDLVAVRLTPRMQVWIELYGTLLLLIPFIAMALVFSIPFVVHSWSLSEVSPSPGGLPMRWLLKGAIPFAFGLLGLAVLSRMTRLGAFLLRNPA